MVFLAVFTQEKDGRFSVTVPALPGCFSEGDTFEDAKKNIEEAIELYLEGETTDESFQTEIQFAAPINISPR